MTTVAIHEGALVLELDLQTDRWMKWDAHRAFTDGIGKLGHTKAVDVCASVDGEGAVFIEVKDFRAAAIENAPRLRSGELAEEVAQKVRDTLAGLVWACDRGLGEPFHETLTREFLERPKARVILWLETDRPDFAGAALLADEVRKRLKPHIEAKVTVTSTLIEKQTAHPLAWLRARGLASPRIAQRPRR